MIYLGIDGGGSRTRFLLVDDQDKELAHIETGTAKYPVGSPLTKTALSHGISKLPVKPNIVCAGFSGAGRPEAAEGYRMALQELLPNSEIIIETDAFIAYIGALGLRPGVLLIAGTGSIALGRRKDGEMIRVGGWGPSFGDEGSGYWIGREAIRTALRAHDVGTCPDFVRAIAQAVELDSITDVVSGHAAIPAVASIARVVIGQYPAEPAASILKEASLHLKTLVENAAAKIGLSDCEKCAVGSVGTNPIIQQLIGIPFALPANPPERGAILWARNCFPSLTASQGGERYAKIDAS